MGGCRAGGAVATESLAAPLRSVDMTMEAMSNHEGLTPSRAVMG